MAREDLMPGMVRFTFEDERFRGLPVEAPGEIITLLWPAPGEPLVLPEGGWRFPPGVAERQHARNYTVRRWEPGSDRVDIDFVVHGDHGRASAWAERAQPGATVGYAASRLHWTPGDADWELLVADETGLPALAAIAEEATVPVHAVIEVEDAARELALTDGVHVTWVHRHGTEPGTGTELVDAVRGLDLPAGAGRAWGGGEAQAMKLVREHLRDDRGLAADRMSVLGYWKHRRTEDW